MAVAIIELSLSSLVIYVTQREYVAAFLHIFNLDSSLVITHKSAIDPSLRSG
jgi:hypothetical protein